jgi:uncharacterized protein YndB with AHSA1/START domain
MGDGGEAVRLERTFRADIERVFRAFTEPAEVVLWWGPMNVRTSVAEIDLRVGGECRWVMHPEGRPPFCTAGFWTSIHRGCWS